MASRIKFEEEDAYDDEPSDSKGPDTSAAEAALKAKLSRKRTKTGCLTCRKRRIKCGEERPVCKNCIKSKRHCDGYNQRVVFKPPHFEYQAVPHGGAHITFQAQPIPGQPHPHYDPHQPFMDPSTYAQFHQPHHHGQYMNDHPQHHNGFGHGNHPVQFNASTNAYEDTSQFQFNPAFQPPFQHEHSQPHAQAPHAYEVPQTIATSPEHAHPIWAPITDQAQPGVAYHDQNEQKDFAGIHGMPPVTSADDQQRQFHRQPAPHSQRDSVHGQFQHPDFWQDAKAVEKVEHEFFPTPVSSTSSRTLSFSQIPVTTAQHDWMPVQQDQGWQPAYPTWPQQQAAGAVQTQETANTTPEYWEHEAHATPSLTPTYMLNAAAVEVQDDDYYDVGSDEEMEGDAFANEQQGLLQQHALSRILAANQISSQPLQSRRYDTFIYNGILDHYRPELVANPLKNPATARVFAHFIAVTGPSLSIFERHPRNTSVLFTEGSIPLSQQGLWTYRMPMAALRNQGLLHAMLALASLHIARLQNASTTPSMQHYVWALRRIHSSVGKSEKRLKVATMAATLLLGFYEIMTADHLKWNMHLAGAKQLFVETDFVKMTKDFRKLKREKMMRHQAGRKRRHSSEELFSQDDMLDQIPDIDERLISQITGSEVRYDDHGSVEPSSGGISAGLDLSRFEILKDLYWWYCKQDVIQSIVSGNPLLMDFSRWANCPPRAPLGKGDAVYGSFDHLVLLLGRIADFSSRDRERKLKQMEANGGHWRPAPGMNMPRPPNQQQGPPLTPLSATNNPMAAGNRFAQPQQPAMPQFYGMAPAPRSNVHMPASYNPSNTMPSPQSAQTTTSADYDLQREMQSALQEYGSIRAALHLFSQSLGEAFQPLTPEYQEPLDTPFGTALFYRSYDIGCLWAMYNMAMLIAIRAHPHMPPAAHMAAAIAAPDTAFFANQIGRIAAGIVPGPEDQPLNPSLGAALCESCMPSFFAAVQYTEHAQRLSTVSRIWSIAKRTGWGSAELIANGCETAWVKAAAAGRGPPWERVARPTEHREDPRLNGSWEDLDPEKEPEWANEYDRRLVRMKANVRLTWAIGVMGVESDVEKMRI